MKLSDALERLSKEFPGVYAPVSYTATVYQTGRPEAMVEFYTPETGHIKGRDLEDCIQQARRLLNRPFVKPEDVDIER